jgi:hypothetical protein
MWFVTYRFLFFPKNLLNSGKLIYEGSATLASAQLQSYSHGSFGVFWNVPASGDNLFVSISGPTNNGWAATGIGSQMKGALIFIIYPAGDGNVTVSPRLGLLVFSGSWRLVWFGRWRFLTGCGVLGVNSSLSLSRQLISNYCLVAAFPTIR